MADGIGPAIGLPPDETVEFFRQKGFAYQSRWDELWEADHGRAFTVTKILNADLLCAVRASLDKVLSEGGTFEMWKADILPQMQAAGWYGKVEDEALTGVKYPVWVGERRLRTIYDTNLRMALAAGQWKLIQQLKYSQPYLMYVAIRDRRTRPLHRLWNGTILPVDHPWWQTHFPPCGWNCRCTFIQLSEAAMRDNGFKPSDGPPDDGPATRFRRSNGEIVSVPRGIDPGFAYNPGVAYLGSAADYATEGLEELAKINPSAARRLLDDLVASPAFETFLAAPDAAFPVMLLDDDLRDTMGATNAVVRLSPQTLEKQNRPDKHPELTVDEYRKLPAIAGAPTLVYKDRDLHIVLVQDGDRHWYKAVVKTTADRSENYLVSFTRSNLKDLTRVNRRGTLIRGQIASWLLALLLAEELDDDLEDAVIDGDVA